MTRANVIQIGLYALLLGALGYAVFRFIGFEGASAGIAAEAMLVLVILVWIGSYLFRVVTGKMTFNEQRKRYLQAYEKITNAEIQAKFDAMSEEDQLKLLEELKDDQGALRPPADL